MNPSSNEPNTHRRTQGAPSSGPSLQLRLVAALGFLAAIGMGFLLLSRQLAVYGAQEYMRAHYNAESDVPVRAVRAEFLDEASVGGRPVPPLGFCWTIELDAGPSRAEVTINPWTREVIDWHAEL